MKHKEDSNSSLDVIDAARLLALRAEEYCETRAMAIEALILAVTAISTHQDLHKYNFQVVQDPQTGRLSLKSSAGKGSSEVWKRSKRSPSVAENIVNLSPRCSSSRITELNTATDPGIGSAPSVKSPD